MQLIKFGLHQNNKLSANKSTAPCRSVPKEKECLSNRMDNDERRWQCLCDDGTEEPYQRWVACDYGDYLFFSREEDFMDHYEAIQDGGDDHTRTAFVGGRYNDLFEFLQAEEKLGPYSVFSGFRFIPDFEYVEEMVGEAVTEIIRLHALEQTGDNARLCFVLNKKFLDIFEKGYHEARRELGVPDWWRAFQDKMRPNKELLNSMPIGDALKLSHGWMLIIVQDKIELAEAEYGRLHEESVAETYVRRLAKVSPTLYARHLHPLFANGVYGRDALVPPIVTQDE